MAQDLQARIDELEHALRVAHRRIDELNTRALQAEGAAEKASIESQLRVGFLEAGMKPEKIEMALDHAMAKGGWKIRSDGQLVRMVDRYTEDRTKDVAADPVTPAQWARTLKTKHADFFPDQPKKSSAPTVALASGIKNPWTRENWNLTEQSKIMAMDVREAHRLAEEAGSPPYASSPPKEKPADETISKATGQPIVSRVTFY